MKAVILAGGYATRLKSITDDGKIAKPLLPISAEGTTQPILYFLLDKIAALGSKVDEIIVVTNEKYYSQFEKACNDYPTKRQITVLSDGSSSPENMRGANGTLLMVSDYLEDTPCEDILIVAGDNYFDFDLRDLYRFYARKSQLSHSMLGVNVVVSKVYPESEKEDIANKFGILNIGKDQRVISLDEKPGIENIKSTNVCLAVYMFNRLDFDLIQEYMGTHETDRKKRDSLGYFINYIINKSKTYTFEFDGNFIDIGSPEDYYSIVDGKKF